ncbi:MAG: DUF975 family protein [Christensenellales bacterium]
MFDRAAIKRKAKDAVTSQYGISLGVYLLFALITSAVTGATAGFAALFIIPPLAVGYAYFCVRVYKGIAGDISDMFNIGFADYGRNLGGVLWMYLFTFLWSLLFIIPGIIKGISYSMTPYILADCPKVRATDALSLSMRMTKGHKGGIFVMYLSFIGWGVLSALTAGILWLVYAGPYMSTAFSGLYIVLKQKAIESGAIRAEELL